MRGTVVSSLVVVIVVGFASCARRGPRDIGNQNPRSVFEDDPNGGARLPDAGGAEPERAIARPTASGRELRELVKADVRALVTDAEHVYFGEAGDDALGSLSRISDAGITPTRIARRAPMPGALALDRRDKALVWIATPGNAVLRAPAVGGATTSIREGGIFTNVVAEGGDVFFTEAIGSGGALDRVANGSSTRLATLEGTPRGLALDAANVFVATSTRLVAISRSGGEVVELARGTGFAFPRADETWLYATAVDPNSRSRLLVRAKKTGGTIETVRSGVRDAPIELHGGRVYWFDAERPALLSLASASTEAPADRAPTLVAENVVLEHPNAFVIDGDEAFLALGGTSDGQIVSVSLR